MITCGHASACKVNEAKSFSWWWLWFIWIGIWEYGSSFHLQVIAPLLITALFTGNWTFALTSILHNSQPRDNFAQVYSHYLWTKSDTCKYWLHIRLCPHIKGLYQYRGMCWCNVWTFQHTLFDQKLSGGLMLCVMSYSTTSVRMMTILTYKWIGACIGNLELFCCNVLVSHI